MFERLMAKGFEIVFVSHARAILEVDFPQAATELEAALLATTIPIEEIIAGGGGEAKGTQRLRKALSTRNWPKTTFTIEKRINNVPRESQSHEVDHVRLKHPLIFRLRRVRNNRIGRSVPAFQKESR